MKDNNTEKVALVDTFKTDSSSSLISSLLLSLGIGIIFLFGIFYLYFHQPKPIFFATGPNNQLIQIAPLDQPFVRDSDLQTWTATTISDIFNFDFLDYEINLNRVRVNFTSNGFAGLRGILEAPNGLVSTITSKKAQVSAAIASVPKIMNQAIFLGPLGQKYWYWNVRANVIISYSTINVATQLQCSIANLVIKRVTPSENPRAIAIQSLELLNVEKTPTGLCQFPDIGVERAIPHLTG
jgi:hypothetical protein